MKTISLITVSLAFAVLLPGCAKSDSAGTVSPNIVYVLADQWRAQATGYNADPNLVGKTPNIDRLAEQGVNFRNAVSVCPVCTPYRAALLTGQFPTTTGMFMNDLHLPEESVTMAELFKEAGYQTCYIGKWHLDGMGRFEFTPPERRQGFEYWKALECSHNYNNLHYYTGDSDEKKYWEGYAPYAETEDAISYIRENAGGDKPFLMVLAWGAPHFPHHTAPGDLQKIFSPENIILRENVSQEMKEMARKESVGYYAHILALDSCMGKLQNALDQAGISENTILVFTSDHGEMMGSQGVRPKQKQVPWAESVKVPFLLRYPARYGKKKLVVDAPINTPDILPTLLSLAGLPVHDAIEGEDMSRAIENKEEAADKAALIMSVSPFAGKADEYRGIYTSRYAYVKTLPTAFWHC
jgi:arylsulfatase A-like enzyme